MYFVCVCVCEFNQQTFEKYNIGSNILTGSTKKNYTQNPPIQQFRKHILTTPFVTSRLRYTIHIRSLNQHRQTFNLSPSLYLFQPNVDAFLSPAAVCPSEFVVVVVAVVVLIALKSPVLQAMLGMSSVLKPR